MAVKLRLRREGTKKKPHYRVVAADSRAPRDGRFIEILGEYHPLDEPSTVHIDHDRALYWLGVGAQPSLQVKKLLRIQGIWQEFKPDDEPTRVRPDAPPVPNLGSIPGKGGDAADGDGGTSGTGAGDDARTGDDAPTGDEA